MTEFKDKNIDKLLSKFFTPDQAEQIKNDFTSADALFEKFPAPQPSQQTLAEIKQRITRQLEAGKRINWAAVFTKTAAVAAVAAVLCAVIMLNFNQKKPSQSATNQQQTTLWQSEEVSTFDAEISQLKGELLAINLGEENGTTDILNERTEQLDLEIVETENTFWKG